MSHVTLKEADTADEQIVDLAALKTACDKLGLEFREGQKTFRTWASDHNGRLVGDYPVPEGYTSAEVASGQCEHAIGLRGKAGTTGPEGYEIGVVPSKKHPGTFSLMYDFWGGAIDKVAGKGLEDLSMHYKIEACRNQSMLEGDMWETVEETEDGEIIVEIDTTTRMGV